MTNTNDRQHRSILKRIAHRAMIERGLIPDFPVQVLAQLNGIQGPATRTEESIRDLRNLVWCSIDNDDSLDLGQLTVVEANPNGSALCIRPLKEDWRAVLKAWRSAAGFACNWSAQMWSADISTLRE